MAEPEFTSEQQVIARFQEMRHGVSTLWAKINDLEAEASEHELVIKALEPMDRARRCYRMVGDVLVERTVGETMPAVQRNKDGLQGAIKSLHAQLEAAQRQLADFQARYKIRVQGHADEEKEGGGSGGGGSKGGTAGQQGVLVS